MPISRGSGGYATNFNELVKKTRIRRRNYQGGLIRGFKREEEKLLKRHWLTFALAMMAVMLFAGMALAEQAKYSNLDSNNNKIVNTNYEKYYGSTATKVYSSPGVMTSKFNADGATNYPKEIYLPNEQDPANYRIHSNYSKNTDACASCHSTHTAVGGSLLQWYTVYDTCLACHDGTVTTTYNVKEGLIGTSVTKATYGGMFGIGTEQSLSSHNVTGAVEVAAAPGGSSLANAVKVGSHDEKQWETEFGCESCHTPHGQGGNARILNPDPNFAQTAAASTTGYNTTTKDGSAYVVAAPAAKAVASGYYYFISGYPYSISVYNRDDNAKLTANTHYTVDSSAGYTKITLIGLDPTAGIRVYGTPAMTVTMDIDNYLTSTEAVKHLSGMNNFCGACHTDYNTQTEANYSDGKFSGSGEKLTGTYSEAYRHQVGFSTSAAAGLVTEGGKMECLTCHVAHGTSKDYWQRTLVDAAIKGPDGTTWATADLVEISGSSALKRMPNMGTCEACHKKEVGNQGYSVNSGTTVTTTANANSGLMSVPRIALTAANGGNPYVGSKECYKCHEGQSKEIAKTNPAAEEYEPLVVTYDYNAGVITNINYDAAQFAEWQKQIIHGKKIMPVEAQALDADTYQVYNIIPAALANWSASTIKSVYNIEPHQVTYAMGSKWKQRYVIEADVTADGTGFTNVGVPGKHLYMVTGSKVQWQIGLNGTTQTWAGYNPGSKKPFILSGNTPITQWKDRQKDCVGCHTTGWDGIGEDAESFKDPGVTCEACHGPGKNHVKLPSAKNIINPRNLTIRQQTDLCGSCHNRGVVLAKEITSGSTIINVTYDNLGGPADEDWNNKFNLREYIFGFLPGDSVKDKYTTNSYSDTQTIFEGDPVFGDTTKMRSDLTNSGHHQQYTEFVQSNMFKSGIISCTTCHSSHNKNSEGMQLKLSATATCATCHDAALPLGFTQPVSGQKAPGYMPWTLSSAGSGGKNEIRSHRFWLSWPALNLTPALDKPNVNN